jgi:hypothetical protein
MNKNFKVKLLLWGGGYPASAATLSILKAVEENGLKVSDIYCSSASAPVAAMKFIKKMSYKEIEVESRKFHITSLVKWRNVLLRRSLVRHEDLLKEFTKYLDNTEHIEDGEKTEIHLILYDKKHKTSYIKNKGELMEYLADTMSFPGLVDSKRFIDGDMSKTEEVINKIAIQKEFVINLYQLRSNFSIENVFLKLKNIPRTRSSQRADINIGYLVKNLSAIKPNEARLIEIETKLYNFLKKYFDALKTNNFQVIEREIIIEV